MPQDRVFRITAPPRTPAQPHAYAARLQRRQRYGIVQTIQLTEQLLAQVRVLTRSYPRIDRDLSEAIDQRARDLDAARQLLIRQGIEGPT